MTSPVWLHPIIDSLNSGMFHREISAALFIAPNSTLLDAFMTEGDVGGTALPIRLILEKAGKAQARQILLCHTHPSGDPRPSLQDIVMTRRLCAGLRSHDMRLMDHLILARDRYFSFRANLML